VSSALENLGYDERAVEKAIAQSRATVGNDFETLLRASLQVLGGAVMKKSQRAGQGE
jgi:Holliday junction resolvasome RuvABC DNA-binding subunit